MTFDAVEYAQAIDDFLLKMEQIQDASSPDISKAMERICHLLRIAEVDVTFYESVEKELQEKGECVAFFKEEIKDEGRSFLQREVTDEGDVAVYRIYQRPGEEDWNEEEHKKILVFVKMLFTFNGRARMMRAAWELTFKSQEMGVYNMSYFSRLVNKIIERGHIGNYAACYFNLKRFSVINQQIGRDKGTLVMRTYVGQLQEKLSDQEAVCRVGGDNFVILFLKDHLQVVMDHLEEGEIPYGPFEGEKVRVTTSAGYYMIPDSCQEADDITDNINVAFNMAKNVTKEPYVFLNKELMNSQLEAKFIETIFPQAIENKEFQVFYQPKILLKDYRLEGAEALCRWYHNGEIIPPSRFIPVLEQTQAICDLDFYMLERVCQDIRRWLDEDREVVRVSVNLTRRHMGNNKLLDHILSIVDRYRVPHQYIEIELTETTTDVEFLDLKNIVSGLEAQGINTSVDDFGVGYSSLNLIRDLPWNVLKIDKSFLPANGDEDEQKKVMLKHLISLSQSMGLKCIVEGVETVEQVKFLKENDCYLAQGYYFDKPLTVDVFEERLDDLKAIVR